MSGNENSDVVKIRWKQHLITFLLGCIFSVSGIKAISTWTDFFDDQIARQQQEMCGTAIAELLLQNSLAIAKLEKEYLLGSIALEKRLSTLEATLRANGIEVPEAE